MIDPYCHSSSILVARPARTVFALMAEGITQGHWAWGSSQRRDLGENLFVGTSIFDGQETYVRLLPDPDRLIVDYEVGRTRDAMQFRNMSRVLPGPLLGLPEQSCVVSLLTWRLASQDDAAWNQISTVHEAEMFMIRGLAERDLP